jgi:hypothetical protein
VRQRIDRIFVVLFAALLAAPLVQMVTHVVPEPLVAERRQPQPIQALWPRLMAMDPTLASDVNRWFNDRYGFRSVLLRLHHEIDYQAFGVADKVLIGSDDWLFVKGFVDSVVTDAHSGALDAKLIDTLHGLRDCLARRGIKLVFVLTPTKSSIYPQFLPVRLPVDPPTRLSRRLAAALEHDPGLTFIDGEKILRQHDDEILFYKTDIHMNFKASAYIGRETVARIADITGRPAPALPPESWVAIEWNAGAEERMLAKFLPLDPDTAYTTSRSNQFSFKSDANGTFESDVGSAEIDNPPGLPLYDLIFRNNRPPAALLPPMMLFGTSYSDGFFALTYNDAFAAVYRTRSNVPERIGPLLRHLPPEVKVFVLEFPEPYLQLILRLGNLRACELPRQ